VFGTHNLARLPLLLDAAADSPRPIVEVEGPSSGDFTSDLPSLREHPWHAWVPIAVGCDNFCTYCIVPSVRGRERSRALQDVLAEVRRLASEGVVEVTLLGQNVNSYGRDLYGAPRFAELLRSVADTGVQRVRFTTSHPKDLSDETIRAIAESPQVCRHVHLPVQSGSDRILAAMNRHYTREDYLRLVDRLYEAMPDLSLTTDIIVGFPGETDDDFEETMRVVDAARYDQAFTFIYSPRKGTLAADMPHQVAREVVQPRFDRLVAAVQASALTKNLPLVSTVQTVLVEGASKRDPRMLSGRTGGNKVIHVPAPDGASVDRIAGTLVEVRIDDAQTWFCMGTLME
jgi:tRNA-2-methylthio-N6-dimethylallyladenosine synthase